MPTGSPGIGFLSSLGIGVTGQYSAIHSNAVATDAAGDTYITGSFKGSIALDPNSTSATFTSANTQDTFVAKYSPAGSLLWARTFAGQSTTTNGFTTYAVSQGSAIAIDGSRDVFVAGGFSGTVNLTGSSGVTQISGPFATTEVYVAKLDPSGNLTWVDTVGGTLYDTDEAFALALDGSGGAVIAGSFLDSATFGATTLTAGGVSDAFVARVDATGQFLWAVASQGGSGSNAQINGVTVDGSGNVDLAGFFSGTVDFDPAANTANLTSAGSNDALLWKLDATGQFVWARSDGSTDYDAATAVAVDASGNVYATGAFSDSVNFGTAGRPDILSTQATYDTFVLKVDADGNEVWVKGLIGPGGSAKGQGVAVDPFGSIHVAGTFQETLDFDPGPGVDSLTSVGGGDAFVAGLDPSGNLIYALQAGQTSFNAALGVAVNASGTVAITGSYSGSIVFGSKTLPMVGASSAFVARVITQTPPPAPSSPVLEASSDTGVSNSDGITSDTSPVLDVNSAGSSSTVQLLRNGLVVGTRIGPGAITDPGPLSDGTYTYTAVQVSPAGLTGPVGPSSSVTILTKPPATLGALTLFPGDDSEILGDGITNVRQPRLSIVANAGTAVLIVNATGTVLGSAYAGTNGVYLVTPSQPIADGVYQLQAMAVDLAGNVGSLGPVFSLTIDTTPPTAPTALALVPADDSGALGDGITNVRQPRLSGKAEAGSTVQVVDGSGKVYGSAVASGDGTFTVKPANALADGTYALQARATDAAGNVSPAGPAFAVTILATPPSVPSTPGLLAADVSGPSGGTLTNVKQPRITGTAKAGTTVDVLTVSGTLLASAMVGMDGTYTAKVTNPLGDGVVTIDVVAIDAAGNVSPASPTLTFTIDTTPPAAPTILALVPADDSGALGDGITNVRQPRLSGKAEAGSTVQVVDGSGKVYGSAVASGDGTFTVKPANALADGTYALQARATDAAGNVGPAGPAFALTILATPPSAPAAPTLFAADATGGSSLTNVRQPRLTGRTIANAPVQILGATGNVLASTTSGADGSYVAKLASPLADGSYTFRVVVTDAAGNVSPPGSPFSLKILATPPAAPSAPTLLVADDSGTLGDRITNVRQPRLTGTTGPGLTVRLINASNQVLGTATATNSGSITVFPSSPLADGTYVLRFVAVDAAGNVGAPGGSISLVILRTPPPKPSAPSLLAADDTGVLNDGMTSVRRPRIVGTAVPGGRVDWLAANGSVVASTMVTASNGSYLLQPPSAFSNGNDPVKVRETDVAGNVGAPSASFGLTIRAANGDDFGDSRTDISVLRPADYTFWVQKPTTGALFLVQFGGPGDVPVNGDFFGNGHNDIAIYRPSTSTFYVVDPVTFASTVVQVGQPGDVPVPADYDGDGKTDFAVFRPIDSTFTIKMSATGSLYNKTFAIPGDIPAPADYLGLGHADIVVYRPSNSTFYLTDPLSGSSRVVAVGSPGGVPVPADFDGDGRADFAVYQPNPSTFNILMSATNKVYSLQFGGPGDIPVVGDYFGNGRADLAVFRPSTAIFYALDIPTFAGRVAWWGAPNAMVPTLAPLTTYFSFGGAPAIRSLSVPGLGLDGPSVSPSSDALIPLTPDATATLSPSPVRKASAVVRANSALSLERWRPGG